MSRTSPTLKSIANAGGRQVLLDVVLKPSSPATGSTPTLRRPTRVGGNGHQRFEPEHLGRNRLANPNVAAASPPQAPCTTTLPTHR